MSDGVTSGCMTQCMARTIGYPTYLHENGHGYCNLRREEGECGGPYGWDEFRRFRSEEIFAVWDERPE